MEQRQHLAKKIQAVMGRSDIQEKQLEENLKYINNKILEELNIITEQPQ